mgnify:FL=1
MRKPDDRTLPFDSYITVRKQAEKALRDAGALDVFPTPIEDIMNVANVREVEDEVLNESLVEKFRKEVGSVVGTLKRALSKVIGLFDARAGLIFIDRTLPPIKQIFVRLHEAGHGFLPWQRKMYQVVEDSPESLDPEVADLFDREANVFAAEVLFKLDKFIEEANDHDFSIFVPVRLKKKYGSSIYSAVRQYVSKNHRACAVIVLNPPVIVPGDGFRAALRRVDSSVTFKEKFGELTLPDEFTPDDSIGAMVPLHGRRATGKKELFLTDLNGIEHRCLAEAFTNTHQVFVLVLPVEELTRTTILLAS